MLRNIDISDYGGETLFIHQVSSEVFPSIPNFFRVSFFYSRLSLSERSKNDLPDILDPLDTKVFVTLTHPKNYHPDKETKGFSIFLF